MLSFRINNITHQNNSTTNDNTQPQQTDTRDITLLPHAAEQRARQIKIT